jgi:hypothetical protein
MDKPWAITTPEGEILALFAHAEERDEEMLTGEYPDDAEPAFINW